jgi:hypothetical protein
MTLDPMKRPWLALAFLWAAACRGPEVAPGPAAPGEGETPPPENHSTSEPPARPAGGYHEAAADREDILETANRAVLLLRARTGDTSLTLQRVVRAETQVVAGRNTRLTLVLTGASGERTATVTVYRDLKGEESLTEVEGP